MDAIDRRLHAERLDDDRRGPRDPPEGVCRSADGAMVVVDHEAWLVLGAELLRWSFGGYTERRRRPQGTAEVLTPPSLVDVLAAGWSGEVPCCIPPRWIVRS